MQSKNDMEHSISFRWLIMFALPTVISTIFMNIYTSVDGIFVARFIDTDALSAINITLPMTYLVTAVGTMFGTGGNALVSKKIGEGKKYPDGISFLCFFGADLPFSGSQ